MSSFRLVSTILNAGQTPIGQMRMLSASTDFFYTFRSIICLCTWIVYLVTTAIWLVDLGEQQIVLLMTSSYEDYHNASKQEYGYPISGIHYDSYLFVIHKGNATPLRQK
jgi:hypothetical protein